MIGASVFGALMFALGCMTRGSSVGCVTWMIAASVAALGFGGAVERLAEVRRPLGSTIAVGMAVLIVPATLLARLGVLTDEVLVAQVIVGLALAGLRRPHMAIDVSRLSVGFTFVVVGTAAAILVVVAIVRNEPPIADGIDHVFAVKRLYDTGALDPTNGFGAGLVGEAVFGWGGGAAAAGVFEAGICPTLVLFVIAGELVSTSESGGFDPVEASSRSLTARLSFAVIATVVVVEPTAPGQASGTLFHLCAILSLRARPPDRTAWPTLLFAAALGSLRHELLVLAVPYAAAAFALPRLERLTPAATAIGCGIWMAAIFVVALLLGVGFGSALGKSLVMLAALPLGALLGRLLGSFGWRSGYAIAAFACAAFLLAVATWVIPPSRHAGSATTAMWLGFAFAILASMAHGAMPGREAAIRAGAASLVIAILVTDSLLLHTYDAREAERFTERFSFSIIGLRERLILGKTPAHAYLAAAQSKAPAGARLAFWGQSAAELDFARNPIRDVSFHHNAFLQPMRPGRLDGIDYLVLEDIPAPLVDRRTRDVTYLRATEDVEDRLELVAAVGSARLFRVK